VASDYEVYSFGDGKSGKLGYVSDSNVYMPTKIPFFDCLFSDRGDLKVKQVSCATNHTMVLDTSGSVYISGVYGQGYHNTPTKIHIEERISQISSGDFHGALVTDSGRLYMFGHNRHGQLGLGTFDNRFVMPSLVALPEVVKRVVCGSNHTVALTNKNNLFVWGKADLGRLSSVLDQDVPYPHELSEYKNQKIGCIDTTSDYVVIALQKWREEKTSIGLHKIKSFYDICLITQENQ
jgi:alpha-tubulin suppressor-like RCC1 family protein